ncbi:probable RNA polymerase II nuclear localization protein SLC7A6OS [Hyperolius riggenbachi]|uniref:probable RNA polymerase II nuclear localization protein SLC7A6OS n=1 Tax=Hyperolius riggenbachi TaxID=752182 RepID=UPI0035A37217
MEAAVLLRVKRKRGADPAEALIISCKRLRTENEAQDAGAVTRELFRLAATVTSQDEPIQKYVHEALSRDRAKQALQPSLGNLQRIQKDLRDCKEAERQESRYRLISSLRPQCDDDTGTGGSQPSSPVTDPVTAPQHAEASVHENQSPEIKDGGSFQVFDMVHEEEESKTDKKEDPETITCNSVKMIRERLAVSEEGLGAEHRENQEEFVYDIYYAESSPHTWIQDILSVQPYSCEQELVAEDPVEEEIYEDEDDENEESNWRNDYPDEEDEEDSDREERYTGYYEDSDEDRGGSWNVYRKTAMREQDEEEDSD